MLQILFLQHPSTLTYFYHTGRLLVYWSIYWCWLLGKVMVAAMASSWSMVNGHVMCICLFVCFFVVICRVEQQRHVYGRGEIRLVLTLVCLLLCVCYLFCYLVLLFVFVICFCYLFLLFVFVICFCYFFLLFVFVIWLFVVIC